MTELLRKAVATLSELPSEKQDVLAAMVLEEIACQQAPSHPLLSIEALEEEARQEYLADETEPRPEMLGTWALTTGDFRYN